MNENMSLVLMWQQDKNNNNKNVIFPPNRENTLHAISDIFDDFNLEFLMQNSCCVLFLNWETRIYLCTIFMINFKETV